MKISSELKGTLERNVLSLSTVDENSAPHTIYVMYAKILDEEKILITDNYMEETKKNLLSNNKVSLTVLIGEVGFELKGTAEYISEGELLEKAKGFLENKGQPCKGVILVSVSNIKKTG